MVRIALHGAGIISNSTAMTEGTTNAYISLGSLSNGPLLGAVISFAIAQLLKFILHYINTGRLDYTRLWGSGGMPSSHTAFVTGLAAAVLVREGPGSTAFAITVVIAAITAYDATGVRLHAGHQASLLNALVTEMPPEHPIQDHAHAGRLRDKLGHYPVEVLAGALLGTIVGLIVQGLGSSL